MSQRLKTPRRVTAALAVLLALILTCQAGPAPGQGFSAPAGKPVIVEFSRPRCPICKEMEAILREVHDRHGDRLAIHFAYRDTEEQLFKQYRIIIVPTLVFLDAAGREVYRHEGLFPEAALMRKLRELAWIEN